VTAADGPTLDGPIAVSEFDAAEPADAAAELMPCCASRRWVSDLVAGRPYRDLDMLQWASDQLLATLDWVDVEQALAAHPRIGARVSGSQTEAAWSRSEQSGAATAPDEVAQQLLEVNRRYERKFGYVFLVCATGLSAAEMIAAAQARLRNDPFAERAIVGRELAKIVRLRLAKAFR
jgi:2-oxo-4-hydroxy-4-carboxy-5-ureidoimidazoline decarboxylase